jgi:Short C-terminal domain
MLAEAPPISFFGWLLAILVILIVGMYVAVYVKKRLKEPDEPTGPGFTLSDLRQLHKSGQMSDEEFERAKAKIVVAAKTAALREPAKPVDPPKRRWNSGD